MALREPTPLQPFAPPRGHWDTAEGIPSSAGWMNPADLQHDSWQEAPGRITLGKTADGRRIAYGDDRHMVTFAGSRAGKTATVLIPNLRTYPGSMVVVDPKGELAEQTAPWRAAMGQAVHILDPFGEVARRGRLRKYLNEENQRRAARRLPPLNLTDESASFNALDAIKELPKEFLLGEAAALGDALILSTGKDPHWGDSARRLLQAAVLLLVTGKSDLPANLNSVVRFFASADVQADFFGDMASLDNYENFLADTAATNLARLKSNEYASIISTGDTQLGPLRDLARVSAGSSFDLRKLKRQPMTIYLVLPASKIGSHFHWLRLVLTLALAALERDDTEPQHPVLFVLEEFAALGNMRPIERAAGYMAGFGVKLWPILQDLPQLRTHYEKSWPTFLGNAGVIQAFGLNDGDTEEFISRRLGVTQYEDSEIRNDRSSLARRVSENRVKRSGRLLEPHEVRMEFSRESWRQIVMLPNLPPIPLFRLSFERRI